MGDRAGTERFLRQHLKENPNVDLISFFILRTPMDNPGVEDRELSLIPFPVQKLFTTELASFDVVIFQNFDFEPYNMARYLPNIRDAIEGGLGFVMLGGEHSFGRNYQGTVLDEVLPLRLDRGAILLQSVTPTLTEIGRRHPVTDLARDSGDNDKTWTRLPKWISLNTSDGLMPKATALVVDPSRSLPNGDPMPLVSVMEVGKGRSMAIASDSMWRWRFSQHRNGGVSERAYHRFWSNALRWLVGDPEHSRIRVQPSQRRFDLGQPAEVVFSVLGRDYKPVPFAHVRATLQLGNGTTLRIDELETGESGVVRHRYENLERSSYRVEAAATASGEHIGNGSTVFVVESTSLETSQGSPRPKLLKAIAGATHGKYIKLQPGVWQNLALIDPDVVEVSRRRNIEIWDNAWALAAAIALFAAEWAMRRRRGYL
ncbi:MAG: hypothetical protein R3C68_09270 [Myxococcota bacterium]